MLNNRIVQAIQAISFVMTIILFIKLLQLRSLEFIINLTKMEQTDNFLTKVKSQEVISIKVQLTIVIFIVTGLMLFRLVGLFTNWSSKEFFWLDTLLLLIMGAIYIIFSVVLQINLAAVMWSHSVPNAGYSLGQYAGIAKMTQTIREIGLITSVNLISSLLLYKTTKTTDKRFEMAIKSFRVFVTIPAILFVTNTIDPLFRFIYPISVDLNSISLVSEIVILTFSAIWIYFSMDEIIQYLERRFDIELATRVRFFGITLFIGVLCVVTMILLKSNAGLSLDFEFTSFVEFFIIIVAMGGLGIGFYHYLPSSFPKMIWSTKLLFIILLIAQLLVIPTVTRINLNLAETDHMSVTSAFDVSTYSGDSIQGNYEFNFPNPWENGEDSSYVNFEMITVLSVTSSRPTIGNCTAIDRVIYDEQIYDDRSQYSGEIEIEIKNSSIEITLLFNQTIPELEPNQYYALASYNNDTCQITSLPSAFIG